MRAIARRLARGGLVASTRAGAREPPHRNEVHSPPQARLSENLVRIPLKEGFDMSCESKWPIPPRGIESMVIDDLSVPSGTGLQLRQHLASAELLRAAAAVAVELMDYGGADELSIAEVLREIRPELAAHYSESVLTEIAWVILNAELPGLSKQFQALFDEFNGRYFSGQLPPYQVHVVFDLHRAAKEPVFRASVSSGLIRFEERCIYLRYTNSPPMEETLIHEMAHAATNGEHDQEWLYEMARLRAAGAPVPDWELEGLVAEEYLVSGAQSMTQSAKAIEIEDIEARVSELERAAGPQKARP